MLGKTGCLGIMTQNNSLTRHRWLLWGFLSSRRLSTECHQIRVTYYGVLNHRNFDCLFNSLLRQTTKILELRIPGVEGIHSPSQKDSNAEIVSRLRHYHGIYDNNGDCEQLFLWYDLMNGCENRFAPPRIECISQISSCLQNLDNKEAQKHRLWPHTTKEKLIMMQWTKWSLKHRRSLMNIFWSKCYQYFTL